MTKPSWIKVKALSEESYNQISSVSHKYDLHTVCEKALCPNINECWSARTATFLLMGDICTRNCRFCSVKTGNPKGYLDEDEPHNIAKAVKELGLKHIVLTSVDRDDLQDGGAEHLVKTILAVRSINPEASIEILIPDFKCNIESLKQIVKAKPDVIGHNIETVERLTPIIRDKRADYRNSLNILRMIKELNPGITIKSALQVGLGEAGFEVKQTITDLKENNVDIVVIGQYLRPTKNQIPVAEYISLKKFKEYENFAKRLQFRSIIASPLARSSYKAANCF